MSNTFKVSETLRQMALTDRKLSWLGGIAETVAELEEDNSRMSRDIEAYKGAGERYEQEIARKDDAIAGQSRQLKEAAAELEQVKRERDAACADLRMHSTCSTCANAPEHYSKPCCHTCALEDDFMGYKWRGPCAENGGGEA